MNKFTFISFFLVIFFVGVTVSEEPNPELDSLSLSDLQKKAQDLLKQVNTLVTKVQAKIKVIKDSKLVTVGKKVIDTAKTVTIPKIKTLIADIKDYQKNAKTMSIFKKAEVLAKLGGDAADAATLVKELVDMAAPIFA